jgi:hypothetical protein
MRRAFSKSLNAHDTTIGVSMKFALETGRCTYAGIDDFANPDAVTLIGVARTTPPYRRCIAAHGCAWRRFPA